MKFFENSKELYKAIHKIDNIWEPSFSDESLKTSNIAILFMKFTFFHNPLLIAQNNSNLNFREFHSFPFYQWTLPF